MRRDLVPTPSLILDADAFDTNIATMTAFAVARRHQLRPHAKSHKSAEVARRLMTAGAVGSCCATIDEAEALASGGMGGLLITSPLPTKHMLERLSRLLLRGADIMVVADNPGYVEDLAKVAGARGKTLPVVVEIDVGVGRTGCLDIPDAVDLAKTIAHLPSLRFAGVQAYWGNLQQVMPFEERSRKVDAQATKLRALIAALVEAALPPAIVTGGGTGTHWIDASLGLFTELQSGSFMFLDSCYGSIPVTPDGSPYVPSLFVAGSVISSNQPGRVIINAGLKALATDSGRPIPMRGAPIDATYRFMGDEHGAIDFDSTTAPPIGSTIELLTPHCDPTVNLHRRYLIAKGDEIIDEWPIVARGY